MDNAVYFFKWTQTLERLEFVCGRFAVLGYEVQGLRMGAHSYARAARRRRREGCGLL